MKYELSFVLDRLRKVVYGCKSTEQLVCAGNYGVLLICKHTYHREDGFFDLSEYFEQREKRRDLISWLKVIVKKQKVKIS